MPDKYTFISLEKPVKRRSFLTGFTLMEIMIVVAIIALLSGIILPKYLSIKRSVNDRLTRIVLRSITEAFENYAIQNSGRYPVSAVNVSPEFIRHLPGEMTESSSGVEYGYRFTWTAGVDGYTVKAVSSNCGFSGSKNYTLTTGGIVKTVSCSP